MKLIFMIINLFRLFGCVYFIIYLKFISFILNYLILMDLKLI